MPNIHPLVRIIDDDKEIRDAVLDLFESIGVDAVSYDTALAFLEHDNLRRPGVLILDVRMPQIGGLELQKRLAEQNVGLPIIFVTAFSEVETAVSAMKNGAFDFLEKPFNFQKLLSLTLQAMEESVAQTRRSARQHIIRKRFDSLSAREQEVAHLIAIGYQNKTIADRLNITRKTAEFHRGNIVKKMEATNLADLLRMLILLELDHL